MIKLPRLFVEGEFTKLIHPLSLSITENITPLSTASISLLQEEALPPRSYVELYTPYGSAGMFRVRNPRDAYGDDTTSAELEHMISEVGDYVVKEEISEMVPAAQAIARLFHYYEGRVWALGDIEQIGFDEVAVEIDHESVLDGILDIMSQCPDCYLQFDFSQQPWRINVARKSSTVVAEGRLSRNVASATVSYDDTELITRLWYKDYTNSDEGEWTFIDSETIEDYGIIEGKVSTSADMTDAEKWRTIETYLYEHRHPSVSITIQAAELSRITGERMDQFRIGDRMRIALPDYNFRESEIITKVEWSDVINAPNSVNLTLGDEEDTVVKYLHDSTSSGGGGGGGSSKTLDRLYYEFWSDDGYFHSRLEMTYQHLQTEFWEGYNYLSSRVEQTARYWQAEFVNMYDGLRGYVELTAEHWQSEFQNTYAGLTSRIEQTAEHWQSEFDNTYAGLSSRIEQTAQHWESELSDTYAGLSSRIEQTAGYWSSEISNVYNGLSSRVLQTENSWSATVTAIGEDGKITAATIATAINDGKSGAWIDADNVWIGNDKSTTVISGKLEATDITTDLILAKIANATMVTANSIRSIGTLYTNDGLVAAAVYADGNNITNPIMNATVSGNTLTLTKADGSTTTFSKATTLSGAWSGATFTVTASPQGNTKATTITLSGGTGGVSSPDYTANSFVSHKAYVNVNGSQTSGTATVKKILVDATSEYNSGYGSAKVAAVSWNNNVATFSKSTSGANSQTLTVEAAITYSSTTHKYTAKVLASSGTRHEATSGTEAWDGGVASVTASAPERQSGSTFSTNKKTVFFNVRSVTSTGKVSGWTEVSANVTESYEAGQDSITNFSIWKGDDDVSGDTLYISPTGSVTLKEWHKKDGEWVGGTTVNVSGNASFYGNTTLYYKNLGNNQYYSAGTHNWYYT